MKCPYCGSELEFVDYYEGESFYKCPNNSCKYPANIFQKGIWQDLIDGKKAQDALESIYNILILDSTDKPLTLTPAGKREIKCRITNAQQETKE